MATKIELQAQLDEAGIKYSTTASKAELEALLPETAVEEDVNQDDVLKSLGLPKLENHLHVTEVVLNGKKYNKILDRTTGVTTMEPIIE